jgi:glycosyltransferase involved in cell wall biosynthesis
MEYLSNQKNEKELFNAMKKLISNPNFCDQLARNGYKIVQKNCNIKTTTKAYENFYLNNSSKKNFHS